MIPLAWFSLAYKHKHKYVHTRRMAYLTELSIPALLNPMINKLADTILLLICAHEVWVKVTHDWSTALCSCLCLCRPSFHLSKLQHKHTHKQKKKKLVCFSCAYAYAYVSMPMSTQFSLAYTCAGAYAYELVKTRLLKA